MDDLHRAGHLQCYSPSVQSHSVLQPPFNAYTIIVISYFTQFLKVVLLLAGSYLFKQIGSILKTRLTFHL